MTIDSVVMLFAGCVILVGCALTYWADPLWIILPAFVGLNMAQASVTGFCPAAMLLKKLGVKAGAAFK